MLDVRIGPCHRNVPESWDELTPRQYRDAVAVLHVPAPPELLRLRLLRAITRLPWRLLAALNETHLALLISWTRFLIDEQAPGPAKQLLPILRLPFWRSPLLSRWLGPASHLRNCTFGEFIFADTYALRFGRTRDLTALDKLVATLYRPRRRDGQSAELGDPRRPFSEHRVDEYASQLRHLPLREKLAVHRWYSACRAQLVDEFPSVFDQAQTEAANGPNEWGRVLRKLSGGAFGPVAQTAGQPIRLILAELEDLIKAAEEAARRARSQRP